MTGAVYVYALSEARAPALHVMGRTVRFERIGDLYAAIERRSAPPPLSEDELRTQHAIVAAISSASDAVLPARFGAFVAREELARIVALRRDRIHEALGLVRGRSQMNVRILGAHRRAPAARVGRSGESRRPGTRYLLERRAASKGRIPSALVRALHTAVDRIVLDERVEAGEGFVAARVYHLIARGTEGRYRQALDQFIRARVRNRIAATGPWPPFAFVPEIWP
jgi:Gas vesicle synthesis protein GvpL/GvpF